MLEVFSGYVPGKRYIQSPSVGTCMGERHYGAVYFIDPDAPEADTAPPPPDDTVKSDQCPNTGVPMRYCTCVGPHTAPTGEA